MAECTTLLRWRVLTGTGGSNPPLSASFPPACGRGGKSAGPRSAGVSGRIWTMVAHLGIRWLLTASALAAACTSPPPGGPTLELRSDGPRFVDGRSSNHPQLPFRYYGTTTVDVLPLARTDGSHWRQRPVRQDLMVPPPVSRWWFPLDLPIELFQRALGQTPDPDPVEVLTTTNEAPVVSGFLPGGVQGLRERAHRARTAR